MIIATLYHEDRFYEVDGDLKTGKFSVTSAGEKLSDGSVFLQMEPGGVGGVSIDYSKSNNLPEVVKEKLAERMAAIVVKIVEKA